MTSSEKMAELLRRLKVEMNGAVVDDMRRRGIVYPLSYGVSIPTIRDVARVYAPDHSLARLLYRQQVRELKIAALTIADPTGVSVGELAFWAAGVENTEIAEHLASGLLSRTAIVRNVFTAWIASENDLLKYAALLTVASKFSSSNDVEWFEKDDIAKVLQPAFVSVNGYVLTGLVRMLERVVAALPTGVDVVRGVIAQAKTVNPTAAQKLNDELGWLL